MTFEYVLKQNNLFDGTDLTLNYDVAFNLMTSAFEGGTADYCTMFDPVAYEYEAAGKGYVVASVGEASGEVPYTCFMAKQSWLNKNKATAEGFLRAITKAVKYVQETPSTTVAMVSSDDAHVTAGMVVFSGTADKVIVKVLPSLTFAVSLSSVIPVATGISVSLTLSTAAEP